MKAAKACSGKCGGGFCRGDKPRVWVVAACEGMISLFEKQASGQISLIPGSSDVFPSMEEFRAMLVTAEGEHKLDQLVIVGAKGDIAWMHTALPAPVAKYVTAEIEYPLIAGWFRRPLHLALALERVFSA